MGGGRRTVLVVAFVQLLAVVALPLRPAVAAGLPPSEWVVGPQKRVVLLTFDGRTKGRSLLRVLGDLADKKVHASFFLPGSYIRYHPNKAKLVMKSGHKLGNTGWGNPPFTRMSDAAIRSSIDRARKALRRINSFPRPYLRVPKGKRDARVLRVAGSMGYRSVRWTYHPRGGKVREIARQVVRNAQAGSIISLDLWRAAHRAAVPRIIAGLRRRGFGFRTIENLARVHPIRWDITLKPGSRGSEVAYLQKTLRSITYPVSGVDGSFGYSTLQATYAFEKVHRMTRDGVVPPSQMTAIALAQRPRTPDRAGKYFVDVDISRQVLFEIRKKRVAHTIPISSGNEQYYTSDDGEQRKAHTPRGNFSVVRKIEGRRESDLGVLWWPNYFVGGYAIHGSDSVPVYPASHGCVRIPRYTERGFFRRNPVGRPVYVHD